MVEELEVLLVAGLSALELVLAFSVFVSDFVSDFDSLLLLSEEDALASEEAAVLSAPSFLAGAEL